EGTKSLRGMPQVIHRQISLGPDEHLVELEVDTSRIRNTAVGVGAGVAVAGVVSGVAVAAGVPGGNDLLQFLTAAVPGLAVAAGSMIATARGWLGSVRRGMLRALDGIAHPELYRRASKRRMRWERQKNSGWQQLVGAVADALEHPFRWARAERAGRIQGAGLGGGGGRRRGKLEGEHAPAVLVGIAQVASHRPRQFA